MRQLHLQGREQLTKHQAAVVGADALSKVDISIKRLVGSAETGAKNRDLSTTLEREGDVFGGPGEV